MENKRVLSKDRVVRVRIDTGGNIASVETNIREAAGAYVVIEEEPEEWARDSGPQVRAARAKTPESDEDFGLLKEVRHRAVHACYPREKWQAEVSSGETDLGYAEWLKKVSK